MKAGFLEYQNYLIKNKDSNSQLTSLETVKTSSKIAKSSSKNKMLSDLWPKSTLKSNNIKPSIFLKLPKKVSCQPLNKKIPTTISGQNKYYKISKKKMLLLGRLSSWTRSLGKFTSKRYPRIPQKRFQRFHNKKIPTKKSSKQHWATFLLLQTQTTNQNIDISFFLL